MNKKAREKIKSLRQTQVTFQIGKMGLTDKILKHLDERLRKREVLKGRMLKSVFETTSKEELVSNLKNKLNLGELEVRGYTIIIYREKDKNSRKELKKNV
ncbi:MAG: YhbY family RNA-binding protein [Candidatus Odinarchaeum yellowstonii]|uniref:YhbY family RNA-binding protein n=1 Tax=Odinarchaeota yellowstonii (strain LCB_4) TaxID=1841599 RepID=A0AAF0D353_ODILC|nr:MAG: YhbY family RNA-binding protein [Candidatus Odinarchaeum yellowstonii]